MINFCNEINRYLDFAQKFIPDRMNFFDKDTRACLRKYHTKRHPNTHAYFPALQCCLSTLDFLSCLYVGNYKPNGNSHIKTYVSDCMDSQVYTNEKIDILWEGFRHKIAHMAHPEYVIDTSKWRNFSESMRITWIVSQTDRIEWKDIKYDHLEIRRKSGKITSAIRPHDVSYDHIIAIALVQLKSDIIRSTHKYLHHLSENHKLVKKFATVIGHLYPR